MHLCVNMHTWIQTSCWKIHNISFSFSWTNQLSIIQMTRGHEHTLTGWSDGWLTLNDYLRWGVFLFSRVNLSRAFTLLVQIGRLLEMDREETNLNSINQRQLPEMINCVYQTWWMYLSTTTFVAFIRSHYHPLIRPERVIVWVELQKSEIDSE